MLVLLLLLFRTLLVVAAGEVHGVSVVDGLEGVVLVTLVVLDLIVICEHLGHVVANCYFCFDKNFLPPTSSPRFGDSFGQNPQAMYAQSSYPNPQFAQPHTINYPA